MDDIDKLYIAATKVRKDKKTQPKATKSRSTLEVAKETYKAAKQFHKAEIGRLKRTIKSHKLMQKQAKNQLKIVKLSERIK